MLDIIRRGRRAASTTLPRKMASPAVVTARMSQIPVVDVVMTYLFNRPADCRPRC
jgi:succinylarginine dihydrolase